MENASKALLIAASVLIVILLIAFGMRIFNSTKGTGEQVQGTMQTTEMAMFNNKFLSYVGNNKSKTEAISLINQIIVNNSTNNNHTVYVSLLSSGTVEGALSTSEHLKEIINGARNPERFANKTSFTIAVDFDTNGYINLIKMY